MRGLLYFTVIGHGMDLQYLFVPDGLTEPLAAGNPDLLVWQRMARLWANFAKWGLVLENEASSTKVDIL